MILVVSNLGTVMLGSVPVPDHCLIKSNVD